MGPFFMATCYFHDFVDGAKDPVIPFTSNHPPAHKFATIRYLYNRLDNYNLHLEEYLQELQIIHSILHKNSFPITPHRPRTDTPKKQSTTYPAQKWAAFSYVGRETMYITNIF
jgi:hypothetical protein